MSERGAYDIVAKRFGELRNVRQSKNVMRSRVSLSVLLAIALAAIVVYPGVERWRERARVLERAAALDACEGSGPGGDARTVADDLSSPSLLVRVEELDGLLASWQTIGGCGAGAGSASSAGLKWIGRNVTGGLVNVQEQVSYSNIGTAPYNEYNLFVNTFVSGDLSEKWNIGTIVPFVYKYLDDPLHIGSPYTAPINYSNGGLGDISLLVTRRFGRINDTSLTGIVGLPTGKWDATYTAGGTYLNQNAQLGFGKPTAALSIDHTMDEVWGLLVVGGVGAYRGGENKLNSYRAPTASVYSYAGYFLGPIVPSLGFILSGYKGHDIDLNSQQTTPLVSLAAQAGLEWSTDWIAIMVAGTVPYKYDGIRVDESGQPRSPWGFMPWTLALGISVAPF
jgi:hypothetical protein